MTERYILDACALIAYLNDEDGADIVEDILIQSSNEITTVSMSMVNLLEVYYGIYRDFGNDKADEVLSEVLSLPIEIISDITLDTLREAGRLKAAYKMSMADSVALGIASVSLLTIVTADHHEMDPVELNEPLQFNWIR